MSQQTPEHRLDSFWHELNRALISVIGNACVNSSISRQNKCSQKKKKVFMLSVHHWDTQNNKCHGKMQNSCWLKQLKVRQYSKSLESLFKKQFCMKLHFIRDNSYIFFQLAWADIRDFFFRENQLPVFWCFKVCLGEGCWTVKEALASFASLVKMEEMGFKRCTVLGKKHSNGIQPCLYGRSN